MQAGNVLEAHARSLGIVTFIVLHVFDDETHGTGIANVVQPRRGALTLWHKVRPWKFQVLSYHQTWTHIHRIVIDPARRELRIPMQSRTTHLSSYSHKVLFIHHHTTLSPFPYATTSSLPLPPSPSSQQSISSLLAPFPKTPPALIYSSSHLQGKTTKPH